METRALRLHGKGDLRLDTFELPPLAEDTILADISSNSICMSSHKATNQGAEHKRVPDDVADHPIIIGHEFCGTLIEVSNNAITHLEKLIVCSWSGLGTVCFRNYWGRAVCSRRT